MPKKLKNFLGFGRGGLFSTSTTYHVKGRNKKSESTKAISSENKVVEIFRGHEIIKEGRKEFFVPSLDDSPFQSKDDAKMFIMAILSKKKNPSKQKGNGKDSKWLKCKAVRRLPDGSLQILR